MKTLHQLMDDYGSNKHELGYTQHYEPILAPMRLCARKVLEVGIERGGSLRAWRDYFPNAHVIGIDNAEWTLVNDHRISSFIGDQTKAESLRKIAVLHGPFDLIVDDANHEPWTQRFTALTLLPYLTIDGVYAIEDVCPYKFPQDGMANIDELCKAIGGRVTATVKDCPPYREKLILAYREPLTAC